MKIKLVVYCVLALALTILLKTLFWSSPSHSPSQIPDLPVVAISQIVEHSSLDQERQGIIQALEKAGYIDGKTIKIIYQNAQGNMGTAAQIVTQLLSHKPKVMVAISTPSAQAALAPCLTNNVPLVFTAVTDPIGAKLVKDLTLKTEDVTGVSDALSIESQIQLMKQILPQLESVGIVYNPGEDNSVKMVQSLKEALKEQKIQCVEATASKTSDVNAAVQSLIGKVQVIYIPNDNTAVAAMRNIALLAERHKLPLFAGDVGSVAAGALATQGYNRLELGKKAGEQVVRILKGDKASTLPVLTQHSLEVFINENMANHIGVNLPQDILKKAHKIGVKP